MKKRIALWFMLFPYFICAESSIKTGDRLSEIIDSNVKTILLKEQPILPVPDSKIKFYLLTGKGFQENLLVKINDSNIGICVIKNKIADYFLDLDGDEALDIEIGFPIMPAWVFTNSDACKINGTSDNIKPRMDSFYKIFNGTENPYTSGKLKSNLQEIEADIKNSTLFNRDILYALWLYYVAVQSNALLDEMNINNLKNLYAERFNEKQIHPLIVLHIIETAINKGNKDEARQFTEKAVKDFPDFIPLHVYSWQLEQDQNLKEQKYSALKKNYPEHWIVKQI